MKEEQADPLAPFRMTQARIALADAKLAVEEARRVDEHGPWRVRWVAALTLLRLVGHVLHKVEAERSDNHAAVIATWWEQLKARKSQDGNPIFWGFIEQNRNLILKNYSFSMNYMSYSSWLKEYELFLKSDEGVPFDRELILTDGTFIGEQANLMLEMAAVWWEAQIVMLEFKLIQASALELKLKILQGRRGSRRNGEKSN